MLQIERLEKILRFIDESKKADIDELASVFSVSKVTIRRDIKALAQWGMLLKTHGGAVSLRGAFFREIPFSTKSFLNLPAKKAIGTTAASLIGEGEIIILDSGSTTLEIAKNINNADVTVLTNDIKIALELTHKPGVHVMVSGGNLDSSVYNLNGASSTGFFRSTHANKTFLGCDAVDVEFGVSDRTFESCEVKRTMINAADEVILVTDKSKLNSKVFAHLCDISEINRLVIDKIDEYSKKAFLEKGVKIMVTGY